MSRLDDLIQEYCPDGVKFKTLGELGHFYGGITGKSKKDFVDGNAVFISYKNVYQNPALDIHPSDRVKISEEENQRTLKLGDIIFTGSSETPDECGFSSVITEQPTEPLYLNSFCFFFRLDNPEILIPDFAKHLFRSDNLRYQIRKTANGVTRFNVSKDKMSRVKVPLPALPVQREIVRILDEFTLLSAELAAELAARKKQYEYYRDTLLNNNAEIPKIKLGEFAVISRGGNFQKKDFVDNGLPCIHYGQIYTHYGTYADTTLTTINEEAYSKSKKAKKNDIVMAVTSENIEDVCKSVAWLGDKDIAVSGHTAIISHQQNAKYLSYYFSSNAFFKQKKKLAHGTKVIEVTPNTLANIEVPLPSLEVQNRLVEVLDNFNSICSDLNIGLPAEIEARQKQYEFYRNQLLTFAENGNTILTNNEQRTTNNEGI